MRQNNKRVRPETGEWRRLWAAICAVAWIMVGCQSLPQSSASPSPQLVVVFVLIEDGRSTDKQRAPIGSGLRWVNVLVVPMPLNQGVYEIDNKDSIECPRKIFSESATRRMAVILDDEEKASSCLTWHRI